MLIRQHDYYTGVPYAGHNKMCRFITQLNATDVASFEGAC